MLFRSTAQTAELGTTYHYHLTEDSPNLPSCRVGAAATSALTSPDNSAAAIPGGSSQGGGPGAGGPPAGG